jgi:hypothetical protein
MLFRRGLRSRRLGRDGGSDGFPPPVEANDRDQLREAQYAATASYPVLAMRAADTGDVVSAFCRRSLEPPSNPTTRTENQEASGPVENLVDNPGERLATWRRLPKLHID